MLGGRRVASSSLALLFISLVSLTAFSNALQFCGNDLSNAIAIVCSETGYNMPHQSYDTSSDHRFPREAGDRPKRGIVDECCRASCGWATIETYCRPPSSTTTSENLQIQKRSDPPSDAAVRERVEEYSMSRSDPGEGYRHQKRRLFSESEDAAIIKNTRTFHSSAGVVPDIATTSNKVKRNDKRKSANEDHRHRNIAHGPDESTAHIKHDKFTVDKLQYLQIRHHRANKIHHKDIRTGKSSQVGTVSPYYFGKFLVSPKARRLSF